MNIRALERSDFDWVLALSAENELETSHLDEAALDALVRESVCARVADRDAYLIAFAPGAAYASPNYLWFEARYQGFVYVDRIVVSAHARGQGVARALYEDLFAAARVFGAPRVVCEVNSDPPNPGSDAFHARMNFVEVGAARLENGKSVRYLSRDI
ncbi:acetyltransferase of GNAT family [alpha proteobacterium U9-1i]|nr:acetyltransferase of GNAT family [alpha proteobacterium U9-1i]